MRGFVEESGRYSFEGNRGFESSVLLGLMVPDRHLGDLDTFVSDACQRWNKSELKGAKLKPRLVLEVADFVASLPLAAVAYVTDNHMSPLGLVRDFRLRQASEVAAGLRRYCSRREVDAQRVEAAKELLESVRAGMSDVEFLQQQQVPELLYAMVQRVLDRFYLPEWDSEFERFTWVLDAKLPQQLSPGERYAHEHAMRAVGSTERYVFTLPQQWRNRPEHPFLQLHSADAEHTSLNSLWEGTRVYHSSHEHAGLQLADVIASVVRRAVDQGSESPTWDAYDRLRMTLTDGCGECLTTFRFRGAPEPDPWRYRPLMRAWPETVSA